MNGSNGWLDRSVAVPGPYLKLCTDEYEFADTAKYLKIKPVPLWVNAGANATTHHLYNEEGDLVCIVCVKDWKGRDPIEVASLLVHEAIHVWQEYAASIGENAPGREQEAYAIQLIAQRLMYSFSERMK